MAQLPNISERAMETPQYSRGTASYRPSQVGDAIAGVGKEIGVMVDQEQEKKDQIELAYAKGHLLRGMIETENSLEKDADYSTYKPRYIENIGKTRTEALGMITNPALRARFDAEANTDIIRGVGSIENKAIAKEREAGRGTLAETLQRNKEAIFSTSDPKLRAALIASSQEAIGGAKNRGYIKPEEAVAERTKFTQDYGETWLEMQQPTERLKLLTPKQVTGADSAIQTVLRNEGGFVPTDGSSGAPAIYGINGKWHPEAYAEAKKITDSQGQEAGQKYASDFYKKEYWDKFGIEKLPPESQTIVMDGVVNHSSAFATKLVDAAKTGATPEQLTQMRRDEYTRLATSSPDKYGQSLEGWNSRLDNLGGGEISYAKTGTPADFIPVTKRAELYKQTVAAAKADIELRSSDPMTYAQVHGLTPNQSLDFSNPQTLQTQIQDRSKAAVKLNNEYNAPLQIFTKEEAARFTTALETQNTDQQINTLVTLRDSTPNSEVYQAALQQIRPDSPVTAMAGMYLGMKSIPEETHWYGDTPAITSESVAKHLLDGEALLNPAKATAKENGIGKIFPMPTDGTANEPGLRAQFNSYVGDSFRGQPMAADQAYQAFKAYYAAEASKQGDYSGVLNTDITQAANRAVVGTVVDTNGKKVIAPWGMDETTFRDLAKVRFDDITKAFGFSNLDYSDVALENTGEPGKYRALVGAGYLLDAGGKPLTISLSR